MAWLTEVRIAPAEPLRYIATELALELNEVCSVNFAFSSSNPQGIGRTFTTDELLRFEFLLFLLGPKAVLHSSKVWNLAFET